MGEKETIMRRPTPINEEYEFSDGIIVSSTDLKGIITYANRKFCEIADYTKKELTGKNHNVIRHPDMPKAAFEELWDTLHKGKSWSGLVKNLRKDGKYYWVSTHITPIKDNSGKVIGYTAARRPANKEEVKEVIPVYKDMLLKEKNK
jgi:aerotaxis receptor